MGQCGAQSAKESLMVPDRAEKVMNHVRDRPQQAAWRQGGMTCKAKEAGMDAQGSGELSYALATPPHCQAEVEAYP